MDRGSAEYRKIDELLINTVRESFFFWGEKANAEVQSNRAHLIKIEREFIYLNS